MQASDQAMRSTSDSQNIVSCITARTTNQVIQLVLRTSSQFFLLLNNKNHKKFRYLEQKVKLKVKMKLEVPDKISSMMLQARKIFRGTKSEVEKLAN